RGAGRAQAAAAGGGQQRLHGRRPPLRAGAAGGLSGGREALRRPAGLAALSAVLLVLRLVASVLVLTLAGLLAGACDAILGRAAAIPAAGCGLHLRGLAPEFRS